jgi:SAM-dependent methyltransferase
VKIPVKVTLSHVPGGRSLAHRIGAFNHGPMLSPRYAITTFDEHFDRTMGSAPREGFTCLEVGPGESLSSALVARARGASQTWLVDVAPFASAELADYGPLRAALAPDLDTAGVGSVDELLTRCKARYLTAGIASLREVPTASVDFAWSQAVLEHVRVRDMTPLLAELRRVLKPTGVSSHRVDLEDHLDGGLNNLRFSDRLWEASWMAGSGFYTNRLRYEDLLQRFREAGFAPDVIHTDWWDALPLPRARMAPEFRDLPLDDLLVSGFDVILRPV